MNNCAPLEDACDGTALIPCACVCDNCESHDMECQGCDNCAEPVAVHEWVSSIDPRWMICTTHPDEVMIAPAA